MNLKNKNCSVIQVSLFILMMIISFLPNMLIYANEESHSMDTLDFTDEELTYIKQNPTINVLMMDGIAPLEYIDDSGTPAGISVALITEISQRTGFEFTYRMANTLQEILEIIPDSNIDLLSCMPKQYTANTLAEYQISKPYLNCKTVLYINSNIDPNNLHGKICALTKGKDIPFGVNEENVLYVDTREESLDAVNKGKADFGDANEFSVSYYIEKNGYRNLRVVPTEQEIREYSIVYVNHDPTFHSIINKALASLSPEDMQNIIITGTTQVQKKISVSQVVHSYLYQIIAILIIIFLILSIFTASIYRSRSKIKMQNERFIKLYEVADEYMFEYDCIQDKFHLSDKFHSLLNRAIQIQIGEKTVYFMQDSFKEKMGKILNTLDTSNEFIMNLEPQQQKTFRVVTTSIKSKHEKDLLIIGKLEDITKEIQEKEQLRHAAMHDSMTGILNAEACRNKIAKAIEQNPNDGYVILLDIDYFKTINDTYGHAEGDQVICRLADLIKTSFPKPDIVGRVGGDEFCIYTMQNTKAEVEKSMKDLLQATEKLGEGKYVVTISIGIAKIIKEQDFDKIYINADKALYYSKENGKACYSFYEK